MTRLVRRWGWYVDRVNGVWDLKIRVFRGDKTVGSAEKDDHAISACVFKNISSIFWMLWSRKDVIKIMKISNIWGDSNRCFCSKTPPACNVYHAPERSAAYWACWRGGCWPGCRQRSYTLRWQLAESRPETKAAEQEGKGRVTGKIGGLPSKMVCRTRQFHWTRSCPGPNAGRWYWRREGRKTRARLYQSFFQDLRRGTGTSHGQQRLE